MLQKCKKSTSLILQASCIESRETQGLEIITISMACLASGSEWHCKKKCLSPAKKYKVYKSSINKSLHFAQRRLSSSTRV